MRQTILHRWGLEVWRYQYGPIFTPRWRTESWRWHDGRTLRKAFLRIGEWVYCAAWYTR